MEKKATEASPAMALASRVLPVPGGPWRSTPLGMRPPSRLYFSGFLRNSTISCSSSLASAMPATSLKVTRSPCTGVNRDDPEPARTPRPSGRRRLKMSQAPKMSTSGSRALSRSTAPPPGSASALMLTPFSSSCGSRAATSGLKVPNGRPAESSPVIAPPRRWTRTISPARRSSRNSL